MAQGRITKRVVDGLKTTGKEFFIWDSEPKGFGVRVQASGAKSYVFKYSAGTGRGAPTRRMTLARVGSVTPDEARVLAKQRAGEVVHGADPVMDRRKAQETAGDTLRAVVEKYLAREAASLRTAVHRRATFKRLVFDKLGDRPIADIKRSEINDLLDKIEDKNGPRMATVTLGYLGRVMNWYAARSDDFRSPLVRGMARGIAGKRDRVLDDEELRAFWLSSRTWDHPFSLMLRFVLLTATRRDEAADMQWSELAWTEALGGYLWTIRAERYKTKVDHEVPLSGAAWDVLTAASMPVALRKAAVEREALPSGARKQGEVIPKQGFVFTTNGTTGLAGFGKFKRRFDALMLVELRAAAAERGEDPKNVTLPRWTIHDLRRTARSLMTRAGIAPDHAERCLGHVIGGVRGVYDRHAFSREKRDAFEALAAQIERILNPADNVVALRGRNTD